ncbi:MFS transporter [Saccharopolyspora sp. 5N708]|uniref:MFS transporter n=1 Tax=Saccharopolyspora sp. 5N708 TaxID=3457424 RepID=UPI003FD2DD9E
MTPNRRRLDVLASGGGAAIFSCSLGIAGLALPLLAIEAGYGATALGVLTALSAVSQVAVRLVMSAMLRKLPDRVFVAVSGACLAVSCGLGALSSGVAALVAAQLLQGVARGFFWTGTQTHAVRMSAPAVKALAQLNVLGGVGLLVGPVLAGALTESSAQLALAVGAVFGGLTVLIALLLVPLPPFAPGAEGRSRGALWRQPGMASACWAGATAGAWRGLLGSYVPLALELADQSATTIGVLVSVATGASLAGSGLVGRVRGRGIRWSLALGILSTGIGTGVVGLLATDLPAVAAALAVSGLGAGVLQTVGPAVATDAVLPEQRGEAVAATGTFRAAALFLAPFAVSGLVAVAPVALALALAGALMSAPIILTRTG